MSADRPHHIEVIQHPEYDEHRCTVCGDSGTAKHPPVIPCPGPQEPVFYACCKCCEGNAVCAARPDRHEFPCSTKDVLLRYTCEAVEVAR